MKTKTSTTIKTKTSTTTKSTASTAVKSSMTKIILIMLLLLGGLAWIEADRIRQWIAQYTVADLTSDLNLDLSSDFKFEKILNPDLPDTRIESSQQQDLKMQQLYAALQSQDVKQVLPLLDPSLQQEIHKSPELIQDVFRLIPEGEYERWQVATRSQSVAPKVGAITTLVYVFDYTLDMLAITVMFKGHDGTATIMAISVDRLKK